MSRIKSVLAALKANNRKALIPYITAGDPHPDYTLGFMHSLVNAGADIIELGVPFSDPMADGPVIQLACERALIHNVSLKDVLEMVRVFRETNTVTPVVLMGYLNPIEMMGYSKFVSAAASVGVDGILVVDLPPEESEDFAGLLRENEMDSIYLIAPTSSDERIKSICEHSSGYVYYVSVKGVTGSGALDHLEVQAKVNHIREQSQVPVGVGFGIKDARSAAEIAKFADGVIVGSVLVNAIADNQRDSAAAQSRLEEIIASMRQAMDEVTSPQV
ncbi:MAG: tryptophan synthase subunit alpha [Hahellaceae bacterium]|nr:tryptophan synthase subunit alpha [Hahellaceae bacterium]